MRSHNHNHNHNFKITNNSNNINNNSFHVNNNSNNINDNIDWKKHPFVSTLLWLVGKENNIDGQDMRTTEPSWPGDSEKQVIEYLKDHSSSNYNEKVGVKRPGSPLFHHKISDTDIYNLNNLTLTSENEEENYDNGNQSPNGWGLYVSITPPQQQWATGSNKRRIKA